jgi:hypothetical protein
MSTQQENAINADRFDDTIPPQQGEVSLHNEKCSSQPASALQLKRTDSSLPQLERSCSHNTPNNVDNDFEQLWHLSRSNAYGFLGYYDDDSSNSRPSSPPPLERTDWQELLNDVDNSRPKSAPPVERSDWKELWHNDEEEEMRTARKEDRSTARKEDKEAAEYL